MSVENKARKNTWVNRMKDLFPDYVGFLCCVIIVLVVCIITLVLFLRDTEWSIFMPVDRIGWGVFGDFIGGLLGTLVAIFSVYYLIRTLRAQQEANKNVTDNYKDVAEVYQVQQFENNYQHLISLYKEAISGYHQGDFIGRGALKEKMKLLSKKDFDHELNYKTRVLRASFLFEKEFYIPNRVVAAVHFRVLYQIFNLINSSDLDQKKYKAKYAKLVRSQIDEDELLLLRYNCWCKYGEKMRELINRYNLLKHLPLLSLLEFQYWHDKVILDEISQNAIDTELIAQRKWIIENFSNTVMNTDKCYHSIISPKYSLTIKVSNNKKSFSYVLIRCDNVENSLSIDDAYDMLGDLHMNNFIQDFLHEVFECSNFEMYNKLANIRYREIPIVRDKDKMMTFFEIQLNSDLPICLRYTEYLIGGHEVSPQKLSSK